MGAGHVCMVLGGVHALSCQAMLSLSLLCCRHVAIVVVVVTLWQWPQASHNCCHCGVALSPSPSFCGHIIVVFGNVVVGS